jgi:hypothetical protein
MIRAALSFFTGGSLTRLAATLLAGVALGGWAGWQVQGWRADHNRVAQVERQARDTLREVERRDTVSTDYLKGQTDVDKTHTQIIERVRVINARPAAAVQCLDADGLRELGAAIDNGATAAAPGPGPAVPAAAPPG